MTKYIAVFKQTVREFAEDKAPRLGAALAYYTIFSIGPLLLIAVAMAGIIFGEEAAQGRISNQLTHVFGAATAQSVEQMIDAAAKPKSGTVATIVGIVTLFIGASGFFGQLKDALNTIWNVEPRKKSGLLTLVMTRFLSLAAVLGVGFLLLVALVFDAMISAVGDSLGRFVGGEPVLQIIQVALSFVLATVLFAAIFRFLPDLRIAWHDVWFGALFTSFLFVLGKWGLGLYLGKAAVGSSYGAAGSLVILLVWVYWSAQILFFGAEFTQVYARTFGSLQGDSSKRDARAVAERPEDRPRLVAARERPESVEKRPSSGAGLGKLAAGGAVGFVAGAVVGVVSLFAILTRSLKKVLTSFR